MLSGKRSASESRETIQGRSEQAESLLARLTPHMDAMIESDLAAVEHHRKLAGQPVPVDERRRERHLRLLGKAARDAKSAKDNLLKLYSDAMKLTAKSESKTTHKTIELTEEFQKKIEALPAETRGRIGKMLADFECQRIEFERALLAEVDCSGVPAE